LAFLLRNWEANLAFSKAYVFAVFVKPMFERRGIGKRLMEATDEEKIAECTAAEKLRWGQSAAARRGER
jgi:hypothetical protein